MPGDLPPSPVPRRGLRAIAIILVAFAFLAIYANIQKARKAHLETVTVEVEATPSPTATPTPGR
jgi:hypothetical protein